MSEMATVDPSLFNADLAPVAPERRTWNWWHIAALWIGMAICIPTYLAGMKVLHPTKAWGVGSGT
jgi:NCS1 family nucleobase:cation symporter-1